MALDSTILKSGTLKGKPIYNYGLSNFGCETTCGTKQNWSLSISPAITGNKTRIKVNKFMSVFTISMDAESTEGGICKGDWEKVSDPAKHQIEVNLKIYDGNTILSNNTYFVRGGSPVSIPITEFGRYNFTIKTKEWGEECTEPKNTSTVNIFVEESTSQQETGGNGGGEIDTTSSLDNDKVKYVLATAIGAGVMIIISNLIKND